MNRERKRSLWPWVAFAVFVLYPLSVGPLWGLQTRGRISEETYIAIGTSVYQPLFWCGQKFEPLGEWLEWYGTFWEP